MVYLDSLLCRNFLNIAAAASNLDFRHFLSYHELSEAKVKNIKDLYSVWIKHKLNGILQKWYQ